MEMSFPITSLRRTGRPIHCGMEKSLKFPGGQGETGEKIRKLRMHAGLTLSNVSGATGLAVSTLSKIEKGRMSLSFDKLTLIARALDVDIAEVLNAELGAGMAAA